jgi:ATP-dependent Clp protease ATP-binding subunit ClpB
VIQRELQDKLAEKLLEGSIADGQTVQVDAGDGGLLLFPEAATVTEAAA